MLIVLSLHVLRADTMLKILLLKVRKEIEQCYELIHRLGRGVIYLGSARPRSNHPHYTQALELSRKASTPYCSLFCTSIRPAFILYVSQMKEKCVDSYSASLTSAFFFTPPQVASLLNCTTWTGAGPGLMDAAIRGALQAGKPVGGFKIEREAGQWSTTGSHPYLPPDTYLTCRYHL